MTASRLPRNPGGPTVKLCFTKSSVGSSPSWRGSASARRRQPLPSARAHRRQRGGSEGHMAAAGPPPTRAPSGPRARRAGGSRGWNPGPRARSARAPERSGERPRRAAGTESVSRCLGLRDRRAAASAEGPRPCAQRGPEDSFLCKAGGHTYLAELEETRGGRALWPFLCEAVPGGGRP